MNKKAHLPTILLFPFAIVLAIILLFSFISFNASVEEKSSEFEGVSQDVFVNEQYVRHVAESSFSQASEGQGLDVEKVREEFTDIVKSRDLNLEQSKNFFDKVEDGEFEILTEEGKLIFEMKNVSIESTSGANQLTRQIDLSFSLETIS